MSGSAGTNKSRWIICLFAFIALITNSPVAFAQSNPVDCSSYVTVTTANARSTVDPRTRMTTSTADVTITNKASSGKTFSAPLRAVISINNAKGTVTMPEALGGPGTQPYGKYYYDLSSKLTNGQLLPGAKVTFGVKFVRASTVTFTYTVSTYAVLAAPNQPPVANAGTNRTLTLPTGQTSMDVLLDGSASTDPDGTVTAYTWSGTPKPADVQKPTVTLSAGSYTFTLVVTDNSGAVSQPSTVTITVNPPSNQPPVANPGTNRTVSIPYGQTNVKVTLDGSASTDPDGTIAGYTWSGTPKPDNVIKPTVTLAEGSFTFSLVVTDNNGAASASKNVVITVVKEVVHLPQISVSPPPYQVAAGSSTPLNITVSATSPDSRSVTLTASPQLINATFSTTPGTTANGTFALKPSFTQTGIYLVTFSARDTYGITNSSTIQIRVTSTNRPPVLTLQDTATVSEGNVLKIPVTATDPDGDTLTLTATGLPANAVFVPASGAITFSPALGQAGVYPVVVTANDGQLAVSRSVSVTVTPASGGGQGETLTLAVDPVESPSFLTTQRITGTVNSAGQPQTGPKSALITGMSPTTGEQGATLSVNLTGDVSNYVTHFAPGSSAASFGTGILVKSLTVSGPTQAMAIIAIDQKANEGPHSVSVTTGTETAVSINAFNVLKGHTAVTGRLVDPATGQAIAGATVVIQGTNITATTDANGYYTLQGVPTGQQILIVNAPNREVLTSAVDVEANTTVTLDDLKPNATVFDPAAPPSVSIRSIIGRGLGDTTGRITVSDARKLIIDTMLLVGGNEAGVLDAYGNQLNPYVTGLGLSSLKDDGVQFYAERLAKGGSISLIEVLYDISFAFQWQPRRPTYLELLNTLQAIVNQAWANPNDPMSALTIAIFNPGKSLTPNAPILSENTQLTSFQAYLLINSFMCSNYKVMYGANKQSLPAKLLGALKKVWETVLELIVPSAYAEGTNAATYTITWNDLKSQLGFASTTPISSTTDPTHGGLPSAEDIYKKYYMDMNPDKAKEAVQDLTSILGNSPSVLEALNQRGDAAFSYAFSQALLAAKSDIGVRQALEAATTDKYWKTYELQGGQIQTFTVAAYAVDIRPTVISVSHAPDPPYIRIQDTKEKISSVTVGSQTLSLPAVEIVFYRSSSEETDKGSGARYYYRLWREQSQGKVKLDNGKVVPADFVMLNVGKPGSTDIGAPTVDPMNSNILRFVDPLPPPGRNGYRIDCVKVEGNDSVISGLSDADLAKVQPWFEGFMDEPLTISIERPNGLGGLGRQKVRPGYGFLTDKKVWYNVSPFSNAVSVYVTGQPANLRAFPRVDLAASYTDPTQSYISIPSVPIGDRGSGMVFQYNPNDGTLNHFVDPGFMTPGQVGLAMDSKGDLYVDNGASDAAYGGRIFRIDGIKSAIPGQRTFVGSVNYYSRDINVARPTAVQQIVMGPNKKDLGEQLYVADALETKVKTVAVQNPMVKSTPDNAWHNVGQPWADNLTSPPAGQETLTIWPLMDMVFSRDFSKLFYTQGTKVIKATKKEASAPELFSVASDPAFFQNTSGCAVCTADKEYLFVADDATGKIYKIPLDDIPVQVPSDPLARQALIDRYTFVQNLDRPGQIRVTDDGKALLISDNTGFRYVRFGFTGRALDADDLPLIGATVTVNTHTGTFSTTSDSNGEYTFTGLDVSGQPSALTVHISHPGFSYADRIYVGGKCHTNLEPTPCVDIITPADGTVTNSDTTTVSGVVLPKTVTFTSGTLIVNGEGVDVNLTNNEFTVPGVVLGSGQNVITFVANSAGPFTSGASLPVTVERTDTAPTSQAVAGVVYNTDGQTPLVNVPVEISVDGTLKNTATTDGCGYYSVSGLPLGTITVQVK
jgi:hypothetical protein